MIIILSGVRNINLKILYLKKRFISLLVLICILFTCFIARLIDWQIINYGYYRVKALQNRSYILKTDPIRGEIFDKFGEGLAVNSIGYRLVLDDFNLTKGKEADCICKMINLLNLLGIEWNDSLPIILNSNNEFEFDYSDESKLELMKKEIPVKNSSDPNSYINYLKKKINAQNLSKKNLRDACSIYYGTRGNNIIADKIQDKNIFKIIEYHIPGFRIATSTERYYPDGLIASHILGYTGLMSAEEYEKYKEKNYSMDAIIGKSGIEKLFEEELKGFGGKRAFHFAKDGSLNSIDEIVKPQQGNSVFLTIISKLQKAAQDSLEKAIKTAFSKGARSCNSGAAVLLDIETGEILAAASCPTFDLTRYSTDKSYRNELINNSNLPLLNRAFNGIYPPGSTFKPLILAAALNEGVLNGLEETINCSGAYRYYTKGTIKCTGHHGNANLLKALAHSCNVFFAELGRRLGVNNLEKYAKELGISGKTGLELDEASGTVYDLEKKAKYASAASQAAIGQGDIAITVLQLAKIASGIASGKNFKPKIVKKIMNYDHSQEIKNFENEFENINISEESLNLTRQAMREVVLTGLATDFRNYPVPVAAKTGTAQNAGDDHTTFMGYAPFDNPKVAFAVIIANGKYGSVSKSVARDILDACREIELF